MKWSKAAGKLSLPAILFAVLSAALPALLSRGARRGTQITVSAAVSLSASLGSIKQLYEERHPEVSIALNLGASGILQQQIVEGAPADVFISASPQEMDALAKQGLLVAGTRRDLLSNVLVLVCPQGARSISAFKDLVLPRVKRVAMANPESVPAGTYGKQTLEYFKIYGEVEPKLLRAQDVRQALAYAETGDADAAIVYATEAKLSSKVRVVAIAPPISHAPILYPVAVLKRSRHAAAAEGFVNFLFGPKARQVFERAGFKAVTNRSHQRSATGGQQDRSLALRSESTFPCRASLQGGCCRAKARRDEVLFEKPTDG